MLKRAAKKSGDSGIIAVPASASQLLNDSEFPVFSCTLARHLVPLEAVKAHADASKKSAASNAEKAVSKTGPVPDAQSAAGPGLENEIMFGAQEATREADEFHELKLRMARVCKVKGAGPSEIPTEGEGMVPSCADDMESAARVHEPSALAVDMREIANEGEGTVPSAGLSDQSAVGVHEPSALAVHMEIASEGEGAFQSWALDMVPDSAARVKPSALAVDMEIATPVVIHQSATSSGEGASANQWFGPGSSYDTEVVFTSGQDPEVGLLGFTPAKQLLSNPPCAPEVQSQQSPPSRSSVKVAMYGTPATPSPFPAENMFSPTPVKGLEELATCETQEPKRALFQGSAASGANEEAVREAPAEASSTWHVNPYSEAALADEGKEASHEAVGAQNLGNYKPRASKRSKETGQAGTGQA